MIYVTAKRIELPLAAVPYAMAYPPVSVAADRFRLPFTYTPVLLLAMTNAAALTPYGAGKCSRIFVPDETADVRAMVAIMTQTLP